MFTNYQDCVLNYVASVRQYLNLESAYQPNAAFSQYLQDKQPKQIIMLLIDGMGSRLIERKLDKETFLRRNLFSETATVFPPTTTAATTSILNGRSPNMNAWLGWFQYYKEVKDIVIPFFGKGGYSHKEYGKNFAWETIPTPNIIDELKARGIGAHDLYPAFREDGSSTIEEMVDHIVDDSFNSKDRFIYAYWDFYDSIMHDYGPDDELSDAYLMSINNLLENASKDLNQGTMLIVLADHGQIEVKKQIDVVDTPLNQYLCRPTSLEARATAFYLKPGTNEMFEKTFKENYADDFILLTHQQVLDSHLFGDQQNHERFEELIGDYLAIAKNNTVFVYNFKGQGLANKGQHAGCHVDERMIPIITFMN